MRWNYIWKRHCTTLFTLSTGNRRTHNYCYCGILLYLATGKLEKAHGVVNTFEAARIKYTGKYRMDFCYLPCANAAGTIL